MGKCYRIAVEYEGYDTEYDFELEARVGRNRAGSGIGFGIRDLEWNYYRRDAAERAYNKLKRFKRYKTRVRMDESS